GEYLERGRPRHLARDPDETWMLLGPDVALCGEEGAKLSGCQRCSVSWHDAGHDLVAGHWVWHAVRCRLRVVVVAGEHSGAARVHELADGFGGIEQLAARAEPGWRAPAPSLRVQHSHTIGQFAKRTRRGIGGAADRHAALGRTEPVYHLAAEALG